MARAALAWKVRDLAFRAGVNPSTVSRIENGSGSLTDTLARLRAVLEANGIVFIPPNGLGPGVRLRSAAPRPPLPPSHE